MPFSLLFLYPDIGGAIMFLLNSYRVVILALILFGCLIAGCSYNLSDVRKLTYPPDFNYIEPQTISSEMVKMAAQIRLLDSALLPVDVNDSAAKAEQNHKVLTALKNIEEIASKLNGNSTGSNHPYMQDFMISFVAKVDEARIAASLVEPRYYFAGKVAGACAVCHKVNRS